jgi:uncharacterized protein (TIGR03437 family)
MQVRKCVFLAGVLNVVLSLAFLCSSPLSAQPSFSITTASPLPSGTVGTAYSQQLAATPGFPMPYTWSVGSGTLPAGLSLSISGLISGTPTTPVTSNVVINANSGSINGVTNTTRKAFSITINLAPLAITTSSLASGNINVSYSQTVTATGGLTPYAWSASGLPNGLGIASRTGTISGTPTQSGSFSVTVTVADSAGNTTPRQFTLSISSSLRITTSTISNPQVGVAYSQAFSATGGVTPFTWSVSAGALPSGLSINPSTGVIAGTPSAANTFTFTIKVTDAQQSSATQMFSVSVTTPITFLTTSVGNGTVGVPYSQQINATGGAPPLVFSLTQSPFGGSSLPLGLTLNSTGAITGTPTTVGAYSFTVLITDSLTNTNTNTYSVTISTPQGPIQVSPSALTFSASSAGASPASQLVTVISGNTTPANFTITLDGGQANTPVPSWLAVTPSAGVTPAVLTVTVNPNGLNAGAFSGRILVAGTGTAAPMAVAVTLTVASAPVQPSVTPAFLRYQARVQAPGLLDRYLVVTNAGGSGAVNFSVTAPTPIPWLDSITPGSGQAAPGSPGFVRIRLNTSGLAVGGYKGKLLFTSGSTTVTVPISVFVSASGSLLDVDQTGLRFDARQGQGTGSVKTVQVLDIGDPGTTVNFTASIANSANWLTISPTSGTATLTQPAPIQFSINSNAQTLASGGYYALVEIADPNSGRSPGYVVVVLNVSNDDQPVTPDPSPQGLLFTGAGTQSVTVAASSSTAVNFTASASTTTGGNWLTVSPASGSVSSAASAKITVATNLTGLKAGVYTGLANIAIGSQVRGVSVTLIVTPGEGAAAELAQALPETSACAPTRVVLAQTGLTTNFTVPAGWPASLSIASYDDCGNALSTASVFASFTNGDQPLNLHLSAPGLFSGTWQPINPTNGMTINFSGSSGTLQPGAAQISGGVTPNVAPVLFANGTLNNYYPDAALSPGLIAQVYGSGLAAGVGQPGALPLPGAFQGTSVMVGSRQAPLYYLSSGQVNVELPTELTTSQQVILVSANNAFTLPDVLDINPLQAGIAAYADGTNNVIAQHADFSYVTAASPAKPGEVVIIYLAGMGATNPAVPSGQGAPTSEPLARVVNAPTVTVGGQNAIVEFAGLAPGFVGLYQIDLQVPANAAAGSLPLIVSQNGVAGNTTNLIVGN